jgi:cell division protein FtsB
VVKSAAAPSDRPPPPRGDRPRLGLGLTRRALALIAVLAILGISYANSLTVYLRQQREIAELEAEVAGRTANIDRLEDELARWQDPDYVRAEARERLGWVMPGEVGYRVIGVDGELLGGEVEVIGDDVADHTDQGPWYERVWSSIKAVDQPPVDPTSTTGPTKEPSGMVTPSDTETPQ